MGLRDASASKKGFIRRRCKSKILIEEWRVCPLKEVSILLPNKCQMCPMREGPGINFTFYIHSPCHLIHWSNGWCKCKWFFVFRFPLSPMKRDSPESKPSVWQSLTSPSWMSFWQRHRSQDQGWLVGGDQGTGLEGDPTSHQGEKNSCRPI